MRVGTPGVVKISSVSVQFLINMNLNHVSCPNTIQKIDSTRMPFRKSKFSFYTDRGMVKILARLSKRLKHLTTLITLL